jgi:hypothetical protein
VTDTDRVTSLTGCGCGKQHLPGKQDTWIDGVLHRYSKPCFHEDEAGKRVYLDLRGYASITDRMAALERVVADLVARLDKREAG